VDLLGLPRRNTSAYHGFVVALSGDLTDFVRSATLRWGT
jgi:hypothetical protein